MASLFPSAPVPPTKLGVYRLLSPNAGIRVSPIYLSGMSIGDKWSSFMGSMNKESSFRLLDAYYDMGGNFIDTANLYQSETSEEFIGEWMEQRGIRDRMVVATKFTNNYKLFKIPDPQQISYLGNGSKSLHLSVEASLEKLRTSYIDILYVHWWDWETSVKEVMDSLHHLVAAGKVLYLGISDTPAWMVARANQYAEDHGKTPFVVNQGHWSVLERSFEREIIPMARTLGLALAPFNVLESGRLRTDTENLLHRSTGEHGRSLGGLAGGVRTEREIKMSRALERVTREVGVGRGVGVGVHAVAIAYVLQKAPYVFPIIGGRKIEHLKANIEALDIVLTDDQIAYLEREGGEFEVGFPGMFVETGRNRFSWSMLRRIRRRCRFRGLWGLL